MQISTRWNTDQSVTLENIDQSPNPAHGGVNTTVHGSVTFGTVEWLGAVAEVLEMLVSKPSPDGQGFVIHPNASPEEIGELVAQEIRKGRTRRGLI